MGILNLFGEQAKLYHERKQGLEKELSQDLENPTFLILGGEAAREYINAHGRDFTSPGPFGLIVASDIPMSFPKYEMNKKALLNEVIPDNGTFGRWRTRLAAKIGLI